MKKNGPLKRSSSLSSICSFEERGRVKLRGYVKYDRESSPPIYNPYLRPWRQRSKSPDRSKSVGVNEDSFSRSRLIGDRPGSVFADTSSSEDRLRSLFRSRSISSIKDRSEDTPISNKSKSVSPKRRQRSSSLPNKQIYEEEIRVKEELKQRPEKKKKIGYIYMLHLEGGYYYVGYTTNPKRRFSQHKQGEEKGGAAWSTLHKPLSMTILKEDANTFEEDMYVKQVMAEKGIKRVRGGSYSTIILQPRIISQLEIEIRNATGRCFHCGGVGHFMNKCRKKKQFDTR